MSYNGYFKISIDKRRENKVQYDQIVNQLNDKITWLCGVVTIRVEINNWSFKLFNFLYIDTETIRLPASAIKFQNDQNKDPT